jgi:hypothetical protein
MGKNRMKEQSAHEQAAALAFDSTQTVRAVTIRELQDQDQRKWFAIQLVVSDRPVNLETMPRLDIFVSYRLYAVENQQGATSRYTLRLGFFTEAETAQTICEYAKTFFRSPSVVRVSAGEQARFDLSASAAMPPPNRAGRDDGIVNLSSAGRVGPTTLSQSRSPTNASSKLKLDKSLSRGLLEEARQVELSRSRTR